MTLRLVVGRLSVALLREGHPTYLTDLTSQITGSTSACRGPSFGARRLVRTPGTSARRAMCFVQQLQPCMARAVRMARPLGSFFPRSAISGVSRSSRKCIYRVALSLLGSLYLRPRHPLSICVVFVSYIPCPLPIIVSYSRSFSPCSLTLATGDYDLSVNLVFSPCEHQCMDRLSFPSLRSFFAFNRLSFFS
ncbi:hypothetical protein EDB92DRAFT_1221264 [Lactarius akahatsu]|uniref:Uncharacterized protein n=1 Tax=Lactarius akahatsu TaxID=416441 RepID=A0AAD4QBG8_9AGAM|nr:hypothetical protein EDB92DRAFT_1221264 [Lactarius akahatsu]